MLLVAIAIGVSAVLLLTSLGEGARLYVTGQFSSLGAHLLIVLPGKSKSAVWVASVVPSAARSGP